MYWWDFYCFWWWWVFFIAFLRTPPTRKVISLFQPKSLYVVSVYTLLTTEFLAVVGWNIILVTFLTGFDDIGSRLLHFGFFTTP